MINYKMLFFVLLLTIRVSNAHICEFNSEDTTLHEFTFNARVEHFITPHHPRTKYSPLLNTDYCFTD